MALYTLSLNPDKEKTSKSGNRANGANGANGQRQRRNSMPPGLRSLQGYTCRLHSQLDEIMQANSTACDIWNASTNEVYGCEVLRKWIRILHRSPEAIYVYKETIWFCTHPLTHQLTLKSPCSPCSLAVMMPSSIKQQVPEGSYMF